MKEVTVMSPVALHERSNSYSFLSDSVCGYTELDNFSPDDVNYSYVWFAHQRKREIVFKPWSPGLWSSTSVWESLRLEAICNFWTAAKTYKISPVTVHLAVWVLNKLLYCNVQKGIGMSRDWFAGVVAVSFRIALKFEERPDALWSIRKIWDALPMFDTWTTIDRRNQYLMKLESECLRTLDDLLDVPLAVQFFDKYLAIGGWPPDLTKEYSELGHYLLALSTFVRGDENPLRDVAPSTLAAAVVVLSVKIVNGDSKRSYEFFPTRFAAFCQLSMKELQPVIKGLSGLLRRKPAEADVLARVYPAWGDHEWQ